MDDATTNIDNIYHLIQNEFDYLDKEVGSFSKRRMTITELPLLARDLYLIHDIVTMTCDKGTGGWIQNHYEEPDWIACAEEAFVRIGHSQVSEGIRSYVALFLSKRLTMT